MSEKMRFRLKMLCAWGPFVMFCYPFSAGPAIYVLPYLPDEVKRLVLLMYRPIILLAWSDSPLARLFWDSPFGKFYTDFIIWWLEHSDLVLPSV